MYDVLNKMEGIQSESERARDLHVLDGDAKYLVLSCAKEVL